MKNCKWTNKQKLELALEGLNGCVTKFNKFNAAKGKATSCDMSRMSSNSAKRPDDFKPSSVTSPWK